MFVNGLGLPYDHRNVRQRGLDAAFRAGGIGGRKPTFHELRHAHASALIAEV